MICQTRPIQPWKEMASAPKDGTDILLADFVGLTLMGFWDGTNWRVHMTGLPIFEPVLWARVPPMFRNSL